MNRKLYFIFASTILVLMVFAEVSAQTPVPGGGSSVGAPIDGFVGLLLIAGSGYAIRNFKDK